MSVPAGIDSTMHILQFIGIPLQIDLNIWHTWILFAAFRNRIVTVCLPDLLAVLTRLGRSPKASRKPRDGISMRNLSNTRNTYCLDISSLHGGVSHRTPCRFAMVSQSGICRDTRNPYCLDSACRLNIYTTVEPCIFLTIISLDPIRHVVCGCQIFISKSSRPGPKPQTCLSTSPATAAGV